MFKFLILLKPVLRGVNGSLHFPEPSVNRHNKTEPATFSIFGRSLGIIFTTLRKVLQEIIFHEDKIILHRKTLGGSYILLY
jgi:hypothetical protein